jgi:hypothetical protein
MAFLRVDNTKMHSQTPPRDAHVPTLCLHTPFRETQKFPSEHHLQAKILANLARAVCVSQLAYSRDSSSEALGPSFLLKWSSEHGKDLFPNVFYHTYCIAHSVTEKEVYIGFAGSDFNDRTDLRTNMDSAKEHLSMGTVHRGFYQRSFAFPIHTINDWLDKGFKVILCGHSLGGAVASTVAIRFISENFGNLYGEKMMNFSVFGFGAPLIGEASLSEHMGRREIPFRSHPSLFFVPERAFTYFVDESDPVPHLVNLFEGMKNVKPDGKVANLLWSATKEVIIFAGANCAHDGVIKGLASSLSSSLKSIDSDRSLVKKLSDKFAELSPMGNLFYFSMSNYNSKKGFHRVTKVSWACMG